MDDVCSLRRGTLAVMEDSRCGLFKQSFGFSDGVRLSFKSSCFHQPALFKPCRDVKKRKNKVRTAKHLLDSSASTKVRTAKPLLPALQSCNLEQQILNLQQIFRHSMSCSRGAGCSVSSVSSLQTPGDANFFSNQLGVPTVEFTYAEVPKTERALFLSEAFFPPESSLGETLDPAFKLHETIAKITTEAILRLATDPVLPFCPLDVALNVQSKLKDETLRGLDLLNVAASLRENSTFFQSEVMRPANDPKERDPAHVRMLNDVLRDLEKSFLIPTPPAGFYRYRLKAYVHG